MLLSILVLCVVRVFSLSYQYYFCYSIGKKVYVYLFVQLFMQETLPLAIISLFFTPAVSQCMGIDNIACVYHGRLLSFTATSLISFHCVLFHFSESSLSDSLLVFHINHVIWIPLCQYTQFKLSVEGCRLRYTLKIVPVYLWE